MKEPFDFGSALRRIRKQKGYTQKRLADVLNLSETTISKYESNTASPPFETVCEIAAWFRVPLDYFAPNGAGDAVLLNGLDARQREIITELTAIYIDKKGEGGLSSNQYELLGKIVESFFCKA